MADEEKRSRVDLRDLIALVGVALISTGLWMIYPPAAFVVAGLLFVGGAWLSARR